MPLINYVAVIGIAMAIVFHAFVPRPPRRLTSWRVGVKTFPHISFRQ